MSNIGTKFNLANRFTFDPNSNSLIDHENDNEVVRLGSNESRILLLLSERPSEVISRNELHEFVWRDQGFEVDDSSLTQAISTLRKMLKDSTKSPMFVKTVPKRGYQLICSVDRAAPLLSNDTAEKEEPVVEEAIAPVEPELKPVVDPEPAAQYQPTHAPVTPPAKAPKWQIRALLILAGLLPLIVVLFTNPAQSSFRELAVYEGIPVMTPNNHPDLSDWLPAIEQCVKYYSTSHTQELAPTQVIATGGQSNQVILNYIHSISYSGENMTVRIFADLDELNRVCKSGK